MRDSSASLGEPRPRESTARGKKEREENNNSSRRRKEIERARTGIVSLNEVPPVCGELAIAPGLSGMRIGRVH